MKIDRERFLQRKSPYATRHLKLRQTLLPRFMLQGSLALHPCGTVPPNQALPTDPKIDAVRSQTLQPHGTVLCQGAELTLFGHP